MDVYDASAMRRSLERGRPDYLERLTGSVPEYPHYAVLQSYFLTESPKTRVDWSACLRLLIAHRAPLDHARKTAAELAAFGAWEPLAELTHELVSLYLDSGYIDVSAPLVETGCWKNEQAHPIRLAIGFDNHMLLRLYLDRLDAHAHQHTGMLESVVLVQAEELASSKCTAVIKEALMQRRLRLEAATAAANACVAAPSWSPRRGRSL